VSYLVLARKYRPQTFDDLVGQEHVTRTLANAISTGRIAHAFLFTGVRGVGKTTSARLLAKCLNCLGSKGSLTGPTATPCNTCAPCREITSGQDLDVQEIDGASYNGVDEVRRLQEGMSFRPARDRFKIYIVDEVHMLSTAAWNAFLKTLEEPPPHVKFIFATTEVHKVPVTILSRCQRYDFKLITTQTIVRKLEQVLVSEHITADATAVQVIAREAAGSMRDAMSIVDQVIAFSGSKMTEDDVTRVLGVADRQILHDLAAALVTGDAAHCLGIVERVAEQGFDMAHVAKDVLRHLRNLVVAKVCANASPGRTPRADVENSAGSATSLRELLDLADEEVRDVLELAGKAETEDLSRLFHGFSRAFDDIVRSGQPRMAFEMTLVRLARRPPLLSLDELLSRVGDLERRLSGGGAPSPGQLPRGGSGGAGGAPPPRTATSGLVQPPPAADNHPTRTIGALALADAQPSSMPSVRPRETTRPVVVPILSVPEPEVLRPLHVPPDGGVKAWRAIVERVRTLRPPLASVLEHAVPVDVGPTRVVVAFEPGAAFLLARANEPDAIDTLKRAVREQFGRSVELALETLGRSPGAGKTIASIDAEQRATELARARSTIESHPLVRDAIRLFGAQIRDVKLPIGEG
jgi:DNA polymerase-3 subunit gamma/tau